MNTTLILNILFVTTLIVIFYGTLRLRINFKGKEIIKRKEIGARRY